MAGSGQSRTFLIFKRDFQEYRKSTIMIIILAVLVIGAIGCGIGMISAAGGDNAPRDEIGQRIWLNILGLVLIMFSFIPQMVCIPVFATRPLTYEKANGVVMSLLATETTPREIWTGKGLAIFIPGLIGSFLGMAILTPFFLSIIPIPASVLLCAFLVMPLAMLMMAIITVQLAMLKNVDLAIAPSYVVGFLLIALFVAGMMTGLLLPGTMPFTLTCVGILVLAVIIEQILASKLKIERIILA